MNIQSFESVLKNSLGQLYHSIGASSLTLLGHHDEADREANSRATLQDYACRPVPLELYLSLSGS